MPNRLAPVIKYCLTLGVAGLVLSGCTVPKLPKFQMPRVHKIAVQQGNVITQDMIDRLKPGMTRSQVAYVMGEPVLRNTFDDTRWDYIYTLDVPNILNQTVHMTLYFEGDQLAYFTGDLAPTSALSQANPDNNSAEPEENPGNTDAEEATAI